MWLYWSPLRLWWRCVHSYRPWPIFTYPQGYSFYAQECIPTIILLSDCRKPEVFDICNKLMLGKDIGIISVHIIRQTYHGQAFSEHWEGAARSPPAERDHTRSITLFSFCKLAGGRDQDCSNETTVAIFYYLVHFSKTYPGFLNGLAELAQDKVFFLK